MEKKISAAELLAALEPLLALLGTSVLRLYEMPRIEWVDRDLHVRYKEVVVPGEAPRPWPRVAVPSEDDPRAVWAYDVHIVCPRGDLSFDMVDIPPATRVRVDA